ncbi:MAG TPA: alpha/beta hydrolase-fold protein [Polyangiaceae bacterium]|nr:alpha/beta hydrolase-fold protein [Polyangiaceae bacterium]
MRHWLWAALGLCGCTNIIFPAPVPMRAVDYPAKKEPAKCLVVFLPGMGDEAEDFSKNGLVQEVLHRGLSIDVVAANATFGYYTRGIFSERLATDVMAPRTTRGYEQVWLIGNSMGGFGTLFYSRQHTTEITGVLALSPYLGEDDLIDEIYAAGGLHQWKAPARVEKMTDDNYQRELMRWLQAVTSGKEPSPNLYLGFGDKDKLRRADELLAAVVPADHLYRDPGAHEWDSWHRLLTKFLDQGPLASSCRAEAPPATP